MAPNDRPNYNAKRPHKALGWRPPEEFARQFSITEDNETLHLSSVA